ncbi:MAG: hypothetical protein ACRD5B_03510 [Nitrososphaeraceae archaeon]|jgi:hypothetical protein
MALTKECSCDGGMTNSNAMEFVITGLRIELRCRKCNGMIRWWDEDSKKITPFRHSWSDEECYALR